MQRLIYSEKYNHYNLGENHPFSPLRNQMTLDLINSIFGQIEYVEPKLIKPEKLFSIHSEEYVTSVENASLGKKVDDIEKFGLGNADNPVFPNMGEAARWQCGGTLTGAELIIKNQADKVLQLGGGFHHAHYDYAAGFCIYNDLALAIKEFIDNGMYVLYLDIDVHHGDGVQEIFYSDSHVLTLSIHESGEYLFPGSGWLHQMGSSGGRGLKANLPLEPFTEGESFLYVLNESLSRALSFFKPDVMVVQAGADAHFSDPLADLMLTTRDYQRAFKTIIDLGNQHSKGNILFTLGGGYSLTATFRIWSILFAEIFGKELPEKLPNDFIDKWEKELRALEVFDIHDPQQPYDPIPRKEKIEKTNKDTLRRMIDSLAPHWF